MIGVASVGGLSRYHDALVYRRVGFGATFKTKANKRRRLIRRGYRRA